MTKETDNNESNDDNIFGEDDSGLFDDFADDDAISENDFLTEDDDDSLIFDDDDDDIFNNSNDEDEDEDEDEDDLFKVEEEKEDEIFNVEDEDDLFKKDEDQSQDIFSEDNTTETNMNIAPNLIEQKEKETAETTVDEVDLTPTPVTKPKKEKKIKEKSEAKAGGTKSIIISVMVASAISMGGSYALLNQNNNESEIKRVLENSEKNATSLLLMENRVLKSIESTKNVNFEINILSKKVERINELEQDSKTLKKYISTTFKKARKNEEAYILLNKKINNLPNSTIQVAQKLVELEKKLSKLDNYEEYKDVLDGVKKAVRTQQNDITSLKKKVKTNKSNFNKSKIAYEDINNKALQNAQKITQNIKGIRNVNQKVMGESSVKDLLKKSQSASKDVRTVSLLFDNNKTVQINNNNNIGYNIVGSIESEVFYIEDENDGLIIYEIGDTIEGYGLIKEIKSNRIVVTERGIIRNTNTDNL